MKRSSEGLSVGLAFAILAFMPAADDVYAQEGAGATAAEVEALRRVRDAFVGAGDFDAAIGPAEQVVGRVAEDDPERPEDVARLARIQAELDDFESAERNYLESIDLIGAAEGEFSITLVEPYHGLGRSYIKNRQFVEAITALEQAQHISQRNLGLYNVSQATLLDDLTTAHLGLGDTAAAVQLQLERLTNAIRRFGEHDLEVIPFRYQLAGYYEQSRMRSAAREQYEEVIATLEAAPEAGEEALLPPLRQLLRIEMLLGDRDEARVRIGEILARTPDLDAGERARSLAALGDSATVRGDIAAARNLYGEAYVLFQDASEERDRLFGQPQMLDFIAPLTSVDRASRSRPYAYGTIVLELDVTADGRASNVRAVSVEPAAGVEDDYVRRVREAHFRPRVVDGVPVATHDLRFTHYFRYYVEPDD